MEFENLIDSSNITSKEWVEMATKIEEYYEQYDAFIILHGTDSMGYTASALSFMLENLGKTVIITGSQIPLTETRNDAFDNLMGSILIAGHFIIPEVCIYFRDRLMRGNRT
jgi:lysophospholipase